MVTIDTLVACKWLVDELPLAETQTARLMLQQFLEGKEELIAPDILMYELGNVLATKTALNFRDIKDIWNRFTSLHIPIIHSSHSFIADSMEFAKQYHVSVYDASYAVLAKEKKCNLVTADRKFVEQVNLPFIKHLSAYRI